MICVWIYILSIVVGWIIVAEIVFARRAKYYRDHPYMWNRRHEGLISFTDRQVYWMTWFWPITLVASLFVGLICWIFMFVDWVFDEPR